MQETIGKIDSLAQMVERSSKHQLLQLMKVTLQPCVESHQLSILSIQPIHLILRSHVLEILFTNMMLKLLNDSFQLGHIQLSELELLKNLVVDEFHLQ